MLLANIPLNKTSMAAITNGAPGKYIGVDFEVNSENKPVITNGPIIEVTLIKLVSAP